MRLTIERDGPDESLVLSRQTKYSWTLDGAAGTLNLPWSHEEWEEPRERLNSDSGPTRPRRTLDEAGGLIADLLTQIPELATQLDDLASEGRRLLHLELELEAQELVQLPFELSKFPNAGDNWLELRSTLPVVVTRRQKGVDPTPIPWGRLPRVLFAWSESGGAVDHVGHRKELEDALRRWAGPDDEAGWLHELENATVDEIKSAITGAVDRPFTHLHILAHGVFDEEQDNDYQLALSKRSGTVTQSYASRVVLANACCPPELQIREWPAVVTLASCDSAGVRSELSSSATIAQELHRRGIPLVVASQFNISDDGARRLAREIYQGLDDPDPRWTLYRAREALYREFKETFDWASMVCYANLPDQLDPPSPPTIVDEPTAAEEADAILEAFACTTFEEFDSGAVHCAVVTSENDRAAVEQGSRADSLLTYAQAACSVGSEGIRTRAARYWSTRTRPDRHQRVLDPDRDEIVVSEAFVGDVFASHDRLDRAIRAMCWADIVVFDLSGFEPGVMFLLGVRAAVRRGLSICSLWRDSGATVDDVAKRSDDDDGELDDVAHDASSDLALPFNVQNLAWTERCKENSSEYEDTLLALIERGQDELDDLPHYLDLPAYDALRTLGTTAVSAKLIPRDEQVLVLCPFDPTYTSNNFERFLRRGLRMAIGGKVEVQRLGDEGSPRVVSQKLYEAIRRTEMCVVDWTRYKPNVFMELGVRLATSRLGAVQIIEEPEDASPSQPCQDAVPDHVADMTALFEPMPYTRESKGLAERAKAMVEAFDEQASKDGSPTRVYRTVVDAIDGSDPGHEPVWAGLSRAADLLEARDEEREGFTQVLFVENQAMKNDAAEAARELRIAAWLYLEHRLRVGAAPDVELVDQYVELGSHVARKLNARRSTEADKMLAREIYERVKEVQQSLRPPAAEASSEPAEGGAAR